MSLVDFIRSAIQIRAAALTADGFGRPLILGYHTKFTERQREYTSLTGMTDDGFATDDLLYLEAAAALTQRPHPTSILIGRREAAVAKTVLFTIPASPDNTTAYGIRINGVLSTYTTDGSATQAELQSNMITQLNANAHAATFTATASGNNVLVTADTAGVGFSWAIETGPVTPITVGAQTKLLVIPASPSNSTTYRVRINGTVCEYTTDGSATQAELQAGILADINLKVGAAVTATTSGNDVLVTGDVAGVEFTYEVLAGPASPITLGASTVITMNHGIAEDIAAVNEEESDWYGLTIVERDAVVIRTAAQACESLTKLFLAQTADGNVVNAVYDDEATDVPATDIATRLKNLGYMRTSVWYTPTTTNMLASAIMAKALAAVAGGITWAIQELIGIEATTLTATQRANLTAKSANGYETVAGKRITYNGTVAYGEFIDIIHGTDELNSLIEQRTFAVKVANGKVGMTQGGIEQLGAAVTSAIQQKVADRLIAASRVTEDGVLQQPAFTVTTPRLEDIPLADRAARRIPASHPIRWEATLEGAIHLTNIEGEVSA